MHANRKAKLRKKEAALAAATAAAAAATATTTIATVTATTAALSSATPSGPRTRSRSRSQYIKSGSSATSDALATSSQPSAASLFDEEPEAASTLRHRPANEKARIAAKEQRAREERELEQATQKAFEELNGIGVRLDDRHWARGEKRDMIEYMRIAERLWTAFRETKEFYPADRVRIFSFSGNGYGKISLCCTYSTHYAVFFAPTLALFSTPFDSIPVLTNVPPTLIR